MMSGEKRHDFPLQRTVVAAGLLEKRVALVRRALDRGLKELLDSTPARVARHWLRRFGSRDAPIQPRTRHLPFAGHRRARDRQHFGHFPLGHAGEVAELNDLTLTGIQECQLLKRFLELQDLAVGRLRGGDPIVERDPERRAGPLGRLMLARVIDEDAAHHLGRDAEEVRPVLPVDTVLACEPDVRLVDQRGGLERVVGPFPPQIASARRRNSR